MKKVILLKNKMVVNKKILPLLFFLSIFTIFFFVFVSNNKENIVNKNFNGFKADVTDTNMDEIFNGTVTANLTRKIFPPMVRINPLIEKQGLWIDGPYWQHIPPLYMYVPLPFIYILNHGVPSADIIRISYITVFFLACLLFITAVYFWEGTIIALLGATIASILLISTKFTQQLMLNYAINNSDLVLFFSVICSFFAIGWYLKQEKEERLKYSLLKISIIAVIVTMPIVVKTLLGAIPLATFLFLIIKDRRRLFDKEVILAFLIPIVVLIIFYLPLYISSPETFMREILVPIDHLSGNELWKIPVWHYYITNILPNEYLHNYTKLFYLGFILSLYITFKTPLARKTKNILLLCGIWFIWNIFIISFAPTKISNFIFQTYIFALFFIVYNFFLFIYKVTKKYINDKNISLFNYIKKPIIYCVLVITLFYSIKVTLDTINQMQANKDIATMNDPFRNFSEIMRDKDVNSKDLVILYATKFDEYAFKYYIIFNTGAESDSYNRISRGNLNLISLKKKYNNIYIVLKDSIKDTSLLKIPHTDSVIGEFSVIKIKNEDLPESFNKDLKEFLYTLPYKVDLKINAYAENEK